MLYSCLGFWDLIVVLSVKLDLFSCRNAKLMLFDIAPCMAATAIPGQSASTLTEVGEAGLFAAHAADLFIETIDVERHIVAMH